MTESASHDVDALIERVLSLSVPLHGSIAHFDETGNTYQIAGPPGVALFERDNGNTISHVSSSPSPMLIPIVDDLRRRHLHAAGRDETIDNSHLPSLLLLCVYLADGEQDERLSLRQIARRPANIVAIDEEAGRHDPELERNDVAMRAWMPLAGEHDPDAGIHPAIVEMRFAARRHERYAPW